MIRIRENVHVKATDYIMQAVIGTVSACRIMNGQFYTAIVHLNLILSIELIQNVAAKKIVRVTKSIVISLIAEFIECTAEVLVTFKGKNNFKILTKNIGVING